MNACVYYNKKHSNVVGYIPSLLSNISAIMCDKEAVPLLNLPKNRACREFDELYSTKHGFAGIFDEIHLPDSLASIKQCMSAEGVEACASKYGMAAVFWRAAHSTLRAYEGQEDLISINLLKWFGKRAGFMWFCFSLFCAYLRAGDSPRRHLTRVFGQKREPTAEEIDDLFFDMNPCKGDVMTNHGRAIDGLQWLFGHSIKTGRLDERLIILGHAFDALQRKMYAAIPLNTIYHMAVRNPCMVIVFFDRVQMDGKNSPVSPRDYS